ncbi:MAG: amidohydrolase family protein [Planctomycetota bacterium]
MRALTPLRPALLLALCALPALGQDAPAPDAPAPEAPAPEAPAPEAPAGDAPLVLRGRVHVGDGAVLEDGAVVIREGKVALVARWAAVSFPAGAQVVAGEGLEITPGLVEASGRAGIREASYAEQASEVVPETRVRDAVDLKTQDWERLVRRGITAVYVAADPASVIGSQGCLLKTAGPRRVVLEASGVKATLGPETWSRGGANRPPHGGRPTHLSRRPTTLMGNVWVFREAFHLARQAAAPDAAQEVLREVLAGNVPLRIQARSQSEIEAAFRLAAEQGVEFTLERADEVCRLLDLIARRKTPVIYGPIGDDDGALGTPRRLAALKLPFCLSAGGLSGEADLWGQALLAVRYGLEPSAALTAVTAAPARILGVADRVGRVAKGLDADLVVWTGAPLAATSSPGLVLIDGAKAFGRLAPKPAAAAKQGEEEAPSPPEKNPQRFK